MLRRLQTYLATLTPGRLVLWFYLIWYFVILVRYFDPSPGLWLTSLGLSAIIAIALIINARSSANSKLDPWPTFRFFVTPFCVSSFAALVKGKGFILIFSPRPSDLLIGVVLCLLFWLATWISRTIEFKGNRPNAQ